MWDIFDKAAHQSSLFLGEILSFGGHKDRSIGTNWRYIFRKEYRNVNEKWEIPSVILVRLEE